LLTTSQIETREIVNKRKIEVNEVKKREKFENFGEFAK